MSLSIQTFRSRPISAKVLTDLWNVAVSQCHGYFPLNPETIQNRVLSSPRFLPERFLIAFIDNTAVGFLHYEIIEQAGYPAAATIGAVLVHPTFRRQGIGAQLLQTALATIDHTHIKTIDAYGAWPYSPFYATLIEGSERSGPFLSDHASMSLFENAGFQRERESLVMQQRLAPGTQPPERPKTAPWSIRQRQRAADSHWLDYVFRGWDLHEHALISSSRVMLSQAIFARMNGLSDFSGEERYAMFGVQTNKFARGCGWATLNLQHTLAEIARRGGQEVELHVYADNEPAVRLYQRVGFTTKAKTVILRRHQES